jgi:hypothetical protein
MKQRYLKTSIWQQQKIADPYQVIADFFSAADISSHRRHIKKALMAATSNRIYRKKEPGRILHEFRLIESLINAAYIISVVQKTDHGLKGFFKFLTLSEWKQQLGDILEFALLKTSLQEAGIEINALAIYFHLIKLVDAAHKIYEAPIPTFPH